MGYIKFDKTQLINLEYSLNKEIIRSNRAGSYACTTLVGCNTRKYHGLLVCPMEQIDGGTHVLLSGLDETIIQHGASFNLGIHRYPGVYEPRGHKYIRDFETEPNMSTIYRIGGVVLKKEMILISNEERILVKYTLIDAHSPTTIRFKPFLAFRNIHSLSKSNLDVITKYQSVQNGIRLKMYNPYPYLYMQFSKKAEYVPVPHWYYNVEYAEELRRGYPAHEDLYVPGYFEMPIKKGEVIIFSAGTSEVTPTILSRLYNKESKSRIPRDNFENCLINSAQQFIVNKGKKTEVIAGFPWFGRWGRDTFISLPGLTLPTNDLKTFKAVIDTMVSELRGSLFPNVGQGSDAALNSVDAPLWFFWALHQYCDQSRTYETIWHEYGTKMKRILEGLRDGAGYGIKMHDNGLLWQGAPGKALTWMDAVVNGVPVTPRAGYAVEINALWYNAIMFSITAAKIARDRRFLVSWLDVPEKIRHSFKEMFWDPQKKYLADVCSETQKDWAIRPNMVFATSLPFSPIEDDEIKKAVLDKIQQELLTPKGLRTLSPMHPDYEGLYNGNQEQRDRAYHQGTVWPWLLGHFCEGYLRLHGKSGVPLIERIYRGFEEDMVNHGIGTISEIYEGDPPHRPDGAISQAWSVAELLRIKMMLEQFGD